MSSRSKLDEGTVVGGLKTIKTTMLFLRDDTRILLALKKRGFGKGKYNGVGGKVGGGETSEEAMVRECQEEIGVTPVEYKNMGRISFIEWYKREKVFLEFDIYVATKWDGESRESDEVRPKWFSIKKIPYQQMFEYDKYWLPPILDGKKVKGFFEYDGNWNLLESIVEEAVS